MKERIILEMIGTEGAYTDNPKDSGGPTKYGITEAVANKYGYNGPMRDMPLAVAVRVYETEYWNRLCLDDIGKVSEPLAERLFNAGVNCGTGRAAKWLQRVLNVCNRNGKDYADVKADGDIGVKTLNALHSFVGKRGNDGLEYLVKSVQCLQGAHYVTLAESRVKDEEFVNGWMKNRI